MVAAQGNETPVSATDCTSRLYFSRLAVLLLEIHMSGQNKEKNIIFIYLRSRGYKNVFFFPSSLWSRTRVLNGRGGGKKEKSELWHLCVF